MDSPFDIASDKAVIGGREASAPKKQTEARTLTDIGREPSEFPQDCSGVLHNIPGAMHIP